jgi:formylglycine-generating enzyme required for sulfatase activity
MAQRIHTVATRWAAPASLALLLHAGCSEQAPAAALPALEDAAAFGDALQTDVGDEAADAADDAQDEAEASGACLGSDAALPNPPMVFVPAGPFMMGCNEAVDDRCLAGEKPYHEVVLSAYHIDATEVTVGDYRACMQACVCSRPGPGFDPDAHASLPVVGVSLAQAGQFCGWLARRLPTEAEWEKAARGTDGRLFPWGNTAPACDQAAVLGCAFDAASGVPFPVGTFSPQGDSPYGARDMAGNVWEWVTDAYAAYDPHGPADPQGPDGGALRVWRGGSYLQPDADLRVSRRFPATLPAYHALGFRCATSM